MGLACEREMAVALLRCHLMLAHQRQGHHLAHYLLSSSWLRPYWLQPALRVSWPHHCWPTARVSEAGA